METHRTIRVEEFYPWHVEVMDLDERESHHMLLDPNLFETLVRVKQESEQAVSFICDGYILCCSGFKTLWPGVGECWTIPSVHLYEYRMAYARTIKNYIDGIIQTCKYHRLQTSCPDDDSHRKWMKFLGFAEGCVRHQFTSDRVDYREFERITP